MPLPRPEVAREALHTRTVTVNSFARDDGLWDIEAELIDVKGYDFEKSDGSVQVAGDPIHHMQLRITIDENFTITNAVADYDAAPYGVHCSSIAQSYADLVGLNLLRRFRQDVRERFSRVAGCTHMSELTHVLPTVAVQTMANRRREREPTADTGKRPFQLEGCHALRLNGPVVKHHYPAWYIKPEKHDGG